VSRAVTREMREGRACGWLMSTDDCDGPDIFGMRCAGLVQTHHEAAWCGHYELIGRVVQWEGGYEGGIGWHITAGTVIRSSIAKQFPRPLRPYRVRWWAPNATHNAVITGPVTRLHAPRSTLFTLS